MPTRPGDCPACGRFIGPLDTCPFCDCPAERQASLRWLRALAVAVALGGLTLLGLAAAAREPDSVAIAAISPSMQFARIRVDGIIAAPPRSGRSRNGNAWFSLTLQDQGARLRVAAFGDAADQLASRAAANAFATGTWMRAEGSLSFRAEQTPSLLLRQADQLQPRPPL